MEYYDCVWALVHTVLDEAGDKFANATILLQAGGRANNYDDDDADDDDKCKASQKHDDDKCKASKKRTVEESDNGHGEEIDDSIQEPTMAGSQRKGARIKCLAKVDEDIEGSTQDSDSLSWSQICPCPSRRPKPAQNRPRLSRRPRPATGNRTHRPAAARRLRLRPAASPRTRGHRK
jgi:hypothetical protein